MSKKERVEVIKADGKRWYDRLSVEFGQLEPKLEQIGEAFRSLDQLLSESQPEIVYFSDFQQTRHLVHQIQAAYAPLCSLPELLNKYSASMSFHTKRATKIVEEQIVCDDEIVRQGTAYSKRLAEWSDEIESYCDGLLGLTSKVKGMVRLVQETNPDSSAKKTVKGVRKILYGGLVKRWNASSRFRGLFEKIDYLSQAEFSFSNGISYRPFERLRKMG